MKTRVSLKRFYHRNKWRIGIYFPFDARLMSSVKAIQGVAFSKTNGCFYLDDSEENIRIILKALTDIADIDISAISGLDRYRTEQPAGEKDVTAASDKDLGEQEDEIIELSRLVVDQPEPVHGKTKKEILPGNTALKKAAGGSKFGQVEFTLRENEGLLVIRFTGRYDSAWIDEMRTYGRLRYDQKRREWLLHWTKLNCDSLADYFSNSGASVVVKRQVVNRELLETRMETGNELRSRTLGVKASEALIKMKNYLAENRYSVRTIKSYLPMLELFFKYFNMHEPDEITSNQVSDFIQDFIIKNGYSASYQNQMVSAIKTWYDISGTGRISPVLIDRPRRGRPLPKVFSKDEVKKILNATRNAKHKLILWMIYSCGLRRSELVNIKPDDLDRDRSILHIREGKGMVDRIVPVSDKVWEKIDDYVESYGPQNYLFEGPGHTKYSVESVYQVFKQSLKRAGIRKEVGVHSLRHSYATHLHESGLDIRYIQELLGHKSTKTTEIYTHVSRRNLVAVRSPIEDLDVK